MKLRTYLEMVFHPSRFSKFDMSDLEVASRTHAWLERNNSSFHQTYSQMLNLLFNVHSSSDSDSSV